MRGRRSLVLILAVGTTLMLPIDAAANGGAYLELDRTHYLPGELGTASTYVRIPAKHRSLLEEGPFHLYLLPDRAVLEEGKAIPAGTVRIGTFEVEHEKGASFELHAGFTMPEVASGYYELGVCNDPCTITGFREGLLGSISVVATRREAELLVENDRLRSRVFGLRREARQTERRLEQVEGELDAQLAFGTEERGRLSGHIARLEEQLASVRDRATAAEARPPFDPWLVGAILILTGVAALLVFRRRRLDTDLEGIARLQDIDGPVTVNGHGGVESDEIFAPASVDDRH